MRRVVAVGGGVPSDEVPVDFPRGRGESSLCVDCVESCRLPKRQGRPRKHGRDLLTFCHDSALGGGAASDRGPSLMSPRGRPGKVANLSVELEFGNFFHLQVVEWLMWTPCANNWCSLSLSLLGAL